METKVFISLAVKDLPKSMALFKQIGYSFNPKMTDERAACLEISNHIYVMLLTHALFQTFTKKQLADTAHAQETAINLTCESREAVDEMMRRAIGAGGVEIGQAQDHGFMYSREFEDYDGHNWSYFWMDPAHQ